MECFIVFLVIVGTFMAAGVMVEIFFLLTLSKALGECRARNRTMEPGMVWLNLIPVFNLAWKLVTVIRVAETLENEYRDRGWHRRDETYGYGLGLASCIALFLFMGLPHLVLKIMYWVKIAEYNGQLAGTASPPSRYDDEDDEDDEDDRRERRRRRRRDRDDEEEDDDRDERKPWDRGR